MLPQGDAQQKTRNEARQTNDGHHHLARAITALRDARDHQERVLEGVHASQQVWNRWRSGGAAPTEIAATVNETLTELQSARSSLTDAADALTTCTVSLAEVANSLTDKVAVPGYEEQPSRLHPALLASAVQVLSRGEYDEGRPYAQHTFPTKRTNMQVAADLAKLFPIRENRFMALLAGQAASQYRPLYSPSIQFNNQPLVASSARAPVPFGPSPRSVPPVGPTGSGTPAAETAERGTPTPSRQRRAP
jgi:hypothetical protein